MRRSFLAAIAAFAVIAAPAHAAGETTHAWMVDRAIELLPPGPLKTLLTVNRPQAIAGAAFPDTGYWVEPNAAGAPELRESDHFGETSHWERFYDAYVAHIRAEGCADLADPVGPCAQMIAHLMGSAGHGLGDELWDWLFEPAMADHGEDPAKNFFAADQPAGPLDGNPLDDASSSPEYAMDVVAVWRYGQLLPPQLPPPPVQDLVEVYASMDLDVTPEHILAGHAVGLGMITAEHAVAPEEGPRVERDMPWSAGHFVTEPGGVEDVAYAIRGSYEGVWRKLTQAQHPAPVVTRRYPWPDSTDVPFSWHPARTGPGPYGGGSKQRVIFVLSNAVDPTSLSPQTARITGPGGAAVPQLPGFPRPGPYGSAEGTHTVLLYPAANLAPCTDYDVVLSPDIRDVHGAALGRRVSWTFRTTGCQA